MFKFNKTKRDMRFLDPESLRSKTTLQSQLKVKRSMVSDVMQSTKHSFVPEYQSSMLDRPNSWITVSEQPQSSSIEHGSFLKLIEFPNPAEKSYTSKNKFIVNDVPEIPLSIVENTISDHILGIFSDSKIYSALIKSMLEPYALNIGHFNHPNSLVPDKFKFFDTISSWIVFLSDEHDSDFLDLFLDRYAEKPTLFLFSKIQRKSTYERIQKFIVENEFMDEETMNILSSRNYKPAR